ncbi:contractile injection system tape measure protein [Shewanella sp. A14]
MIMTQGQQTLPSDKHLIEQAVLDISFPNQCLADEFQSLAHRFMLHDLLPLIDEVFELYSKTDRVISIDNLVIDLGNLPAADYRNQLLLRVQQALNEQLKLLSTTSGASTFIPNEAHQQGSKAVLPQFSGKTHQDISQCDYRSMSKAQASWLQLKYFLEFGVLSWNTEVSRFYAKQQNWTDWFETTVLAHVGPLTHLFNISTQKQVVITRLLRYLKTDKAITCLLAMTQHSRQMALLLKIMLDYGDGQGFSQTEKQFFTQGGWLEGQSKAKVQDFLLALFLSLVNRSDAVLFEINSAHANADAQEQFFPNLRLGRITSLVNVCQQYAPNGMKANFNTILSSVAAADHLYRESMAADVDKPNLTSRDGRQQAMTLFTWALLRGHHSELLFIWSLATHELAKEFVILLRHLGQQYEVRHALSTALSEPMFIDLLTLLEPTESVFILSFKRLGLPQLFTLKENQTHKKLSPNGRETRADIIGLAISPSAPMPEMTNHHRIFWEFTLSYLLVDRGSAFNRKAYLHSMIKQAANHQNVSQARLHQSLCQSLLSVGSDSPLAKNMFHILSELSFNAEPVSMAKGARNIDPPITDKLGLTEEEVLITQLAIGLQQGRIDYIIKHWSRYIAEYSELFRKGLYLYGQQPSVIKMLVTRLSAPMLQTLLGVLAPSEKAFIKSIVAQLTSRLVDTEVERGPQFEAVGVRQYLWQFSLSYLVTERGSVFNKLSYLSALTQQMAAHHNLDHQQLVSGLIQGFSTPEQQSVMQSELMELLVSLLLHPLDLVQSHLCLEPKVSIESLSEQPVNTENTERSQLSRGFDANGSVIADLAHDEAQLLRRLVLALVLGDSANLELLLPKANKTILTQFSFILLQYGRSDIQIQRYLLVLPKSTQYRLIALFLPRLLVILPTLMTQESLLFTGVKIPNGHIKTHSSMETLLLKKAGLNETELLPLGFIQKNSRYKLTQKLIFSTSLDLQISLILWRFICHVPAQTQGIKTARKVPDIASLVQYFVVQMAAYRHLPYQTLLQAMLKEALYRNERTANHNVDKSAPLWLIDILKKWCAAQPELAIYTPLSNVSVGPIDAAYLPPEAHASVQPNIEEASPLGRLVIFQQWENRLLKMAQCLAIKAKQKDTHKELSNFVNLLILLEKEDIVRYFDLMQQAVMQSIDWHFICVNIQWSQRQVLISLLEAVDDLSSTFSLSQRTSSADLLPPLTSSNLHDLTDYPRFHRLSISDDAFFMVNPPLLIPHIKLFSLIPQWRNSMKVTDISTVQNTSITSSASSLKVNEMEDNALQRAKTQHIENEKNANRDRVSVEQDVLQDDVEMLNTMQKLLEKLAQTDSGSVSYLGFSRANARQYHKVDTYLRYLLKHDAAALKAQLLNYIRHHQVMQCLVSIRSNNELVELMTFLYGHSFTQLYTRLRSLTQCCPTLIHLSSDLHWRFWLFFPKALASHHGELTLTIMDFLQDIYQTDQRLNRMFSSWQHFLIQLRVELKENRRSGTQVVRLFEQLTLLDNALEKSKKINVTQSASVDSTSDDTSLTTKDPLALIESIIYGVKGKDANNNSALQNDARLRNSANESDVEQDVETIDKIYVANAGLVLLSPYISRLFTMLSLTQQGEFINDNAQEKALHVLQYLVNAQQDSPEFQLSLNKILCGMKSAKPLHYHIGLTDEEKDTAEGLLVGVIENWRALGNTSVDGLRQTFLQRDGVITLEKEAWKLRIQPKAFDVLLDSLPWSFGVIKLPWMERVLHVEWR